MPSQPDTTTMNTTPPPFAATPVRRQSSWKTVIITLGIVLGCCGIVAAAGSWWVNRNLHAQTFRPVMLNTAQAQTLDAKLEQLAEAADGRAAPAAQAPAAPQRPVLTLSEAEINGFLARAGLADNLNVALDRGSIVANLVVPMEQDALFLAGKTLRLKVSFGAQMGADHRPVLQLSGVSIGGIPLPNAWLGGLKGVNLLASELNADPAVQNLASGVRGLTIDHGELRLELND